MTHRRQLLEDAEVQSRSRAISRLLLEEPVFTSARTIALYAAVANEVSTAFLAAAALERGQVLCYPRVQGDRLHFRRIADPALLLPGAFGVPEPAPGDDMFTREIDLLVVPGVAFSPTGDRLGFGKGYYDRFLAASGLRGRSVGLAYRFQLLPVLPVQSHDLRLSMIATEDEVFICDR